ncbi:hypothetical protein ACEUCJ_15120 [Aeromonas rivipollensis]|uniref:DUF7217 family protein n=1 Tax=Aeromonas rivipollensis TaxID=948519 RepID=UPI0038D1EB79
MLDSPKSQAVYSALKSSGGLRSPAGAKADAAISSATDYAGQLAELAALPKDGIPPGGTLPVIVPGELRDAAAKLQTYGVGLDGSISVSTGLNAAIGQRMDGIASKMAVMGVAGQVAGAMGEQGAGCGALGQAFGVLTSSAPTDALLGVLGELADNFGPLQDIINQCKAVNGASLPPELKAALDSAMAALEGPMAALDAATAQIESLVDDAQAMWGELETTFNRAVETSVLLAALNNPCLQGIADAVMPDEVKNVLDSFG